MTKLLYLEDMRKLDGDAHVIEIIEQPEAVTVILDRTVFYPQGGGQPSDKGNITNNQSKFNVQNVSMQDGTVLHKGELVQGPMFAVNDAVKLHVDADLRILHNRNHTAGHLIDYALENMGYNFVAHKAYHFPQGPYVEYSGTLEQAEREILLPKLEKAVNDLVMQNLQVSIKLIDNDPKKRAMCVQGFKPILCGGTHVLSTGAVGQVTIRKIKNEKGCLRVSYEVSPCFDYCF